MALKLISVIAIIAVVLVICDYYSKRYGITESPVIGGLYASKNEDGTYSVSKILAIDASSVHVQIYRNRFREKPMDVNPAVLTLGKFGDAEGFGISHAPMLKKGWMDTHTFIKTVPIRREDLEGYMNYRQSMKR